MIISQFLKWSPDVYEDRVVCVCVRVYGMWMKTCENKLCLQRANNNDSFTTVQKLQCVNFKD